MQNHPSQRIHFNTLIHPRREIICPLIKYAYMFLFIFLYKLNVLIYIWWKDVYVKEMIIFQNERFRICYLFPSDKRLVVLTLWKRFSSQLIRWEVAYKMEIFHLWNIYICVCVLVCVSLWVCTIWNNSISYLKLG